MIEAFLITEQCYEVQVCDASTSLSTGYTADAMKNFGWSNYFNLFVLIR